MEREWNASEVFVRVRERERKTETEKIETTILCVKTRPKQQTARRITCGDCSYIEIQMNGCLFRCVTVTSSHAPGLATEWQKVSLSPSMHRKAPNLAPPTQSSGNDMNPDPQWSDACFLTANAPPPLPAPIASRRSKRKRVHSRKVKAARCRRARRSRRDRHRRRGRCFDGRSRSGLGPRGVRHQRGRCRRRVCHPAQPPSAALAAVAAASAAALASVAGAGLAYARAAAAAASRGGIGEDGEDGSRRRWHRSPRAALEHEHLKSSARAEVMWTVGSDGVITIEPRSSQHFLFSSARTGERTVQRKVLK